MLLEATTVNDRATWNFGLVRMNLDALRVTFREREVWSVSRQGSALENPLSPYALFMLEQGEKK